MDVTALTATQIIENFGLYLPLYMARCRKAWTSDSIGSHTWNLGWTVFVNDPFFVRHDEQKPFVIYADDGRGNGDYVQDCDTLQEAARVCDTLAYLADERGF